MTRISRNGVCGFSIDRGSHCTCAKWQSWGCARDMRRRYLFFRLTYLLTNAILMLPLHLTSTSTVIILYLIAGLYFVLIYQRFYTEWAKGKAIKAQKIPGVSGCQMSRKWTQEGCAFVNPTHRLLLSQASGIEPATFRLIAQCLN